MQQCSTYSYSLIILHLAVIMDDIRISRPYPMKFCSLQFILGLLLCFPNAVKAFQSATNRTAQVSEPETTLKICMENAARGTQANRGISAYCDSILNPSKHASKICKPIPPKANKEKIIDLDLYLSEGAQNMNDQLSSHTSKNSKLGRAIFIMGNSGSGKTTLVQILSKNLDHLYASYNDKGFMSIIENQNYIENLKAPSKNLIPDYVVNAENKVSFWDCPSFDDTREEEADIAAKYFLQKALDSTSTAKFIFTVSQSAFKNGNDYSEFDLLATNIIRLFKKLSRFEDSIGLVVTKVERYAPNGKYQTDEQISDQIHNFLNFYLNSTQTLLKNEKVFKRKSDMKKKIYFTKSILGSGSTKVYFLRIPEKCGPLSEMQTILNSRNTICKMYTNLLKYSPIASEDFQFTFKNVPESVSKLESEFIPNALKNVDSVISSIATDVSTQFLKRFYDKLAENLGNGINVLNQMKTALNKIGKTLSQNNTTRDSSKQYLSYHVENLYKENDLMLKCSSISSFYELEYKIQFLVKLANRYDPLSRLLTIFVNHFDNIYTDVRKLTEFYEYCNVTRYELADYSKQKLFTNLEPKSTDAQIIEYISKYRIPSTLPENLNSWNTTNLEDRKYLANVIRGVLPHVDIKCVKSSTNKDKKHLIFVGTNLKLSDVLNKGNWPDLCKESDIDIAEVSVLALERVYFDTDIYPRSNEGEISKVRIGKLFDGIEKVGQVKLSIIAPLWKVDETREIVLDGFKPAEMPNSLHGSSLGDRGKDGMDGKTGGNAGTFFGIYSSIENGHLLKISAIGGNGGNGQGGGDGYVGRRGRDATHDDLPSDAATPRCDPRQTGMEFGTLGANTDEQYLLFKNKCEASRGVFEGFKYSKLGGRGQRGGNGGKGGKGGMAGNSGKIEIVRLRSKVNESSTQDDGIISVNSKRGSCGKPGLGGKGGQNGANGDYRTCESSIWGWEYCFTMKDLSKPGQDAANGENGEECNANTKIVTMQPWRVILDYKTQFFGQKSEIFGNFFNELDSNGKISDFLSATSFAIEIEKFEEKIYESGIQILAERKLKVYRDHYEMFLDRLKNYTHKFGEENDISAEEKIALNTVFSTVLGKLVAIRRFDSQLNVIKTKEYFDSLIEQMTVLKAAQRKKIIKNESNKFKEKLDAKVREAEKFIRTIVNPAIENAHSELNSANDKLVQEINEYINAAEEDVEKKKELKKKLEASWLSNLILGAFSFVGSVASMLGPKGKVVGTVINAGVGIAKSIIGQPDVKDKDYENIEVPIGFKNPINSVNDQYFLNQISLLDQQTKCMSESVGNVTGNALQGVESMAENTRKELKSLRKSIDDKNGELDIQDIDKLNKLQSTVTEITETIDQVAEQLDGAIEKLEEANDKLDNESESLEEESEQEEKSKANTENDNTDIKIVKGLAVTMKLVKAGGALVSTVLNKKGVKRMEQAIKNAEQHVKDIEQKKAQFYNDIIPVLTTVNKQLNKVTGGLPGESQVALSVKKWKIKGMLKNMRGFLTQFTQAMKVTEVFQRCFDTLDEALLLMIELYDHIEQYEEKKDLADFIANVNSASDLENIEDPELKGALNSLDFYINANLFLEDYQKGIHAFKQWAFPFANRYLNETKVDKLSRDLPTVISSYTKQIEGLSLALNKYAATTVEGDQFSMVSFFTSDAVSSEPFYKWSNEKWKGTIKKLLAGEPIHLKSDVDMIGQHSATFFKTKSAIKFKSLALVLKIKDESRQKELDKILDHFHMEMKHSGISLYKVMNQHFMMHDKSMTYHYSFEKTKDNSHVTVNGVKYKVDGPGADFLMSPYTWWTFQLSDAKAGGIGFRDLDKFVDEVDLELEGNGVYLEETRVSPQVLNDLKLADYYEVYDSTTKWEFNEESGDKDKCIVTRADIIYAENSEKSETQVFLTSLLTPNSKMGECNTINIVPIIYLVVGVIILLLLLSMCYFYKNDFLGYISVPRRSDRENKKDEGEEKSELCCLN